MKIIALFAGLATSQLALAAGDPVTELVNKLSGDKAAIVSTFPAVALGMTGVVLKRGASHVIVYVEPTGKYMISGVVIDASGKNLSQEFNEKYIPKPDFKAMWSGAEKTAYVEYGSPLAKKVLYVVGESNCGYCKRFHKEVKPYVERGDVAIRWILMGFDDAGDAKAAGVIGAANPKEALDDLYENGKGRPGSKTALEKVKLNHAFAEAYGISGTPFILSRDAEGKVKTTPGAVQGKNLEQLVAKATR